MATQVQFRRGTTGQHSGFTGAVGEVTVDTEKKILCVHDAVTAGGFPLLKEDGSNSNFALGSLSSTALKFAGDPNTGLMSPGADQLHLVTGGVARVKIDSSGTKRTSVPFRSLEIVRPSSTNSPLVNFANAFSPSRTELTSKLSESAFTALVPTPFRPTLNWNTSLLYFAPVLILETHSTNLPNGICL